MNHTFHAYPLTFNPIIKHPLWGGKKLYKLKNLPDSGLPAGESWEISTIPDNHSIINNGRYKGFSLPQLISMFGKEIMGENILKRYGEQFPLLIKIIDTQEDLSIQVHPDDVTANHNHGSSGKDEMWYIMQAKEDSRIFIGFEKDVDRETYLYHLERGTLTELLHKQSVQKGDIYHIPPGRVHAIGGGILLAEIQQTSDITYRLYDWGRRRQLHTDEAMEVIDFSSPGTFNISCHPKPGQIQTAVESEHFTTSVINISNSLMMRNEGLSFHILINISRETIRIDTRGYSMNLPYAHTALVPASINEYHLSSSSANTRLLHTCITDRY
jgi:mannose-6-phosphate isomerase